MMGVLKIRGKCILEWFLRNRNALDNRHIRFTAPFAPDPAM